MNDITRTSNSLLLQRLRTWALGEIGRQAADEIERLQQLVSDHGLNNLEDRDEYARCRSLSDEQIVREAMETPIRMVHELGNRYDVVCEKLERASNEPCPGCAEFVRMQHDIARALGVDADTDSIDLHGRIYGAVSSSQPAAEPVACRKLIDSPYDPEPRYTYRDGTIAGWEPLYAAPSASALPPGAWRSDSVIPAYEWVWVGSTMGGGYSGPFYHETPKNLSDYANADCWCLVAQPPRPAATKEV